ncbi:MAG TPA: adenylate/guanylate cyclase domain-containing protein [Pseudomonadales bacterium]|nr:adenylate/guanylate cyclase domain-containing protein [Pseudomonadales bacterium]
MQATPGHAHFMELLQAHAHAVSAGQRDALETRLWEEYGRTIALLVVDMSGFTRLASDHGIIHYLSMVRRMQLTAGPIFTDHGGVLIKFEADNAFARFDDAGDALRAALALGTALDQANLVTADHLDIHIACGIDHGPCLLPSDHDCYGNPMNRASKLGEDTADPGQILVTCEAMARVLDPPAMRQEMIEVAVGGRMEAVHLVHQQLHG